MRVSLGYTLFATAAAVHALDDTIGAVLDDQGVTRLYGNSFGRPGYNDTYDYVAGNFYEITDGNRAQVPGYNYINTQTHPLGYTSTPTSWSLFTLPQPGYNNREIYYGTGQMFGGSTASNFLAWDGATEGTFTDKWAKEVDDDFWAWENVYPAYKKSVHFAEPDFTINPSLNITFDPTAFDDEVGPL
ncbi:hypothetical protein DL768_003209 [Monosporascus sp. mg162]|nr:hypothetical protein DL768_003209 [Monosporascus sp. mg162]